MKEFLVEITTTVPAGTAKSEVDPEKMLKRCAAGSQRGGDMVPALPPRPAAQHRAVAGSGRDRPARQRPR